jgi:hypothetical protein
MSVVEADFGDAQEQSALFELPPLEKGGAITLSSVKAVPLEHTDTAMLLKSPHMGHEMRVTGTFAGTIDKHMVHGGLIVWTVQVDELAVDI